jgi:acetyl-CoA carboxylase carboxyltransferase component
MQGTLKRTDIIAAWPTARLSFVDPEIGLELAMESLIKEAKDPEAEKQRGREEWMASSSLWGAAGVYGLHDVIDPKDTRKFIFQTLSKLRGNKEKVIGEHRLQDWPTGF